MPKQPLDLQRKNEHLFLSEKYYRSTNPLFDDLQIMPVSLPNVAVKNVDLTTTWGANQASSPLYINAMTGGSPQTIELNRKIALLAKGLNIPMAVGSMSNYLKYLDNPDVRQSYAVVRQVNPDGIIWANLSAHTPYQAAQKCIDLIQADALQVHLNAAQEVVMHEGENNFVWQDNLQQLVQQLSVPVIVKEVGFGMDRRSASLLQQLGVEIIDISGRGGTNFAQIENERNHFTNYQFLQNWGLSTLESLLETKSLQNQVIILASGGIRSPLDIIKCLILGAHAVGIAAPVLHMLQHYTFNEVQDYFSTWVKQIQEIMALLGCQKISDLKEIDYRLSPQLNNFLQQK
ncbi:type 2 isopentenyl-diphosphate Delta-isomerase [Bombilactobacillus bombi]|uniref:type 2 isopentenyl-diphosphate Delta-isomerase n=1 Tax=Bombilactobacillus bombi TaxID=1303590 RepID=UPI0015E60C41|nr:type 2 isopentenyl-diphosphate Delta-isomerase [Bombilactobacillus bombi]